MADMVRAFFALPVREADKPALLDAQRRMKRAAEESRLEPRWVAAEQLHVTLKFLGDVAAEHLPELLTLGARRAAEHGPFSPTWTEVFGFGSTRRARVLVVGVSDPDGGMAALARDVEADVEPFGVQRESRTFVPHVTLARIKRPSDATHVVESAKLEPAPAHFDELRLYRSELRREGSVYTVLGSWPLGVDRNDREGS